MHVVHTKWVCFFSPKMSAFVFAIYSHNIHGYESEMSITNSDEQNSLFCILIFFFHAHIREFHFACYICLFCSYQFCYSNTVHSKSNAQNTWNNIEKKSHTNTIKLFEFMLMWKQHNAHIQNSILIFIDSFFAIAQINVASIYKVLHK